MIKMELNKFKEFLIQSNFIQNMDKKDNEFFIDKIHYNQEFNIYNYYITKYQLSTEDTCLINLYNFHIHNYVENMIVTLDK
jgi:hypothetical protein